MAVEELHPDCTPVPGGFQKKQTHLRRGLTCPEPVVYSGRETRMTYPEQEMAMLTTNELAHILALLQKEYGFGYSDQSVEVNGVELQIGTLQAKLSMMLAATTGK